MHQALCWLSLPLLLPCRKTSLLTVLGGRSAMKLSGKGVQQLAVSALDSIGTAVHCTLRWIVCVCLLLQPPASVHQSCHCVSRRQPMQLSCML
jgi:hypothetical protein